MIRLPGHFGIIFYILVGKHSAHMPHKCLLFTNADENPDFRFSYDAHTLYIIQ